MIENDILLIDNINIYTTMNNHEKSKIEKWHANYQ